MIEKSKREKLDIIIRKGGLGKKFQAYGMMIAFWRKRKATAMMKKKIISNMMKGLTKRRREGKIVCYLKMRAYKEYLLRLKVERDSRDQILKSCCYRIRDARNAEAAHALTQLARWNDQFNSSQYIIMQKKTDMINRLVRAQMGKEHEAMRTLHSETQKIGFKGDQ